MVVWGSRYWLFNRDPYNGTLPETNSSPLKIDGWKSIFLLGFGLFSGAFAVSFREGILSKYGMV